MKPEYVEERYEAQRMNHEFLRAQFEQREIERARIAAYCGEIHPVTRCAVWIAAGVPALVVISYFIWKAFQ